MRKWRGPRLYFQGYAGNSQESYIDVHDTATAGEMEFEEPEKQVSPGRNQRGPVGNSESRSRQIRQRDVRRLEWRTRHYDDFCTPLFLFPCSR